MPQATPNLIHAVLAAPRYLIAELSDFWYTVRRYYRNAKFRRADLRCLWQYWLRNPDRICLLHMARLPKDRVQTVYGETSFATLEAVARATSLSEQDVVYDLGCGRGRGVFWFNAFYHCRAVGIEINPTFVKNARKIAQAVRAKGVEFVLANLLDIDYGDATLIYFYGTAFPGKAIRQLVTRFETLKPGARVASVSYPLTDYAGNSGFILEQVIPAKFVWGCTKIYIHRKV